MTCSALSKTQLTPVTETSSHMLLEPLPLFVFVIESGNTRHFYGAVTVSSPDPLKRIVVQILLMSIGGLVRGWVGCPLQSQSGGAVMVVGDSSGGGRGGHDDGLYGINAGR
jgi:hypothetical protein